MSKLAVNRPAHSLVLLSSYFLIGFGGVVIVDYILWRKSRKALQDTGTISQPDRENQDSKE